MIQFSKPIYEKRLPFIKLTKSKNGQTGTATFVFIHPFIFRNSLYSFTQINGIYLIWGKKEIISTDIEIIFRKGKPFLLKAIFIFKNSMEWFNFLSFMQFYANETGLFFKSST
ncbi:MAG: photosystem II reaction center protein Psb28 [Alphaproteobacteria bacterium]|nr:photosystem II reaction center protein Psb28 [Alphaproteobacteria bacterium]